MRELQRQVVRRVDIGVELVELPLRDQPPQPGLVVPAEPAPDREHVIGCDARGRVELQRAAAPHHVEDTLRAAVQSLRADGDAPRFRQPDRPDVAAAALHATRVPRW